MNRFNQILGNGAVTKIYWGYENGSWKKSKTVNTTGFNSVKNKDKDSFIVTSTEYAPDDPHCCPSINKKFLVSPN